MLRAASGCLGLIEDGIDEILVGAQPRLQGI